MTTVACVLRSGGDFSATWVERLRAGVSRHLSLPHRFVCLTDVPDHRIPGVVRIPHRNDWPKWWPKVSLFRAGLFAGPVLYLDLDTLPVGSLDALAGYSGPLAMLSDFYQPHMAASGVMAWTPSRETEAIHEAFMADPAGVMRRHRARMDLWFRTVCPKPVRLQDEFPGQIVSLKAHARKWAPEGASIVCGHGHPRFSSPDAGWAHDVWKAA